MDPLTHCLLGAVTSQAFFARKLGRLAPIIGAFAGLLPDIDRLFQFSSNPILTMSMHQQFTHTLWFIPLGGLLAMLPFYWLKQLRYRRRVLYGAAVTSYTVHCVFDVLSTHGTAVLWPALDYRVALDWLPYFDPLLVLVLMCGLGAGLIRNKPKVCHIAFIAVLLYAGVGAAQHERAMSAQLQLAQARYHTPARRRVMPTQNNLIVWRSLYQVNLLIYTDALRLPLMGDEPSHRQGDWARSFTTLQLPKALQNTQQAEQAAMFTKITDQWTAYVPRRGGVESPLMDLRNASTPEGFGVYRGIKLSEETPDLAVTPVYQDPEDPTPWSDRWHDITSPTAPMPASLKKNAYATALPTRRSDNTNPDAPQDRPRDFVPIPKVPAN